MKPVIPFFIFLNFEKIINNHKFYRYVNFIYFYFFNIRIRPESEPKSGKIGQIGFGSSFSGPEPESESNQNIMNRVWISKTRPDPTDCHT